MRRTIKLTESELRRMISESVKSVLRENEQLNPIYDGRQDAFNDDSNDEFNSIMNTTGDADEMNPWDIDFYNVRRFGNNPSSNPSYKRMKDIETEGDWDAFEDMRDTRYDYEIGKMPEENWNIYGYYDHPYLDPNHKFNESRIRKIVKESIKKVLR